MGRKRRGRWGTGTGGRWGRLIHYLVFDLYGREGKMEGKGGRCGRLVLSLVFDLYGKEDKMGRKRRQMGEISPLSSI
jgi:hypothetical protein